MTWELSSQSLLAGDNRWVLSQPLQGFSGTHPALEVLEFVFILDIPEFQFWIDFFFDHIGGTYTCTDLSPFVLYKIEVTTFTHTCEEV